MPIVHCPACGVSLGFGRWGDQELIPNGPLAKLVQARVADGYTWSALARAVYGEQLTKRQIDSCRARLRRSLGVYTPPNVQRQRYVTYDLAMKIVAVLGADPVDYGL